MGKLFSEAVVCTIKEHIDAEQGPRSLYLSDQKEALRKLKSHIEQQHPRGGPFTTSQLYNKILKIAFRGGRVKVRTLFERGTSSLRESRLDHKQASTTVSMC